MTDFVNHQRRREHYAKVQRQDSLTEQLEDLHRYAIREGMYDAAEWLRRAWNRSEPNTLRRCETYHHEIGHNSPKEPS